MQIIKPAMHLTFDCGGTPSLGAGGPGGPAFPYSSQNQEINPGS